MRSALVIAVTTLALVLVAGCATTRHPTVAELRQIPGASATYPNTVVYTTHDTEGDYGIDGGNPAVLDTEGCATGATVRGVVIDWFNQTLQAAGWTERAGDPMQVVGDFDATYTWQRGPRRLTVSFATTDHADAAAAAAGKPTGCPVAYEVVSL